MSLTALMTRTVVIQRPATVENRYGNDEPDWTDVTETTTKGWLSQQTADEPAGPGRDPAVSTWQLYLPAGTDIRHTDRVEIDSTVYEVDSPPNPAHRPQTGAHHVEVTLQLVEG